MGQATSLAVTQQEVEVPLLRSWWFWTAAVGGLALVGGAVGAGVYLGTSGSGARTGVNLTADPSDALVGGR